METLSYQKEVKANKEHRCDFCFDKIKKGETYCTSTHKYDGEVYTWKTHKHCSEIADRLEMYKDCDEGVTADDFQETIHNFHDDLMIEQFPQVEIQKYSDVIQQLRHVNFRYKLMYVIRHFARLDKEAGSTSASLLPNPVLSAALSVEEGNILIAEFMGYVYLPDGKINGIKGILVHEDKMSMHLDVTKQFHAKYHSSWDWLMPVVEKIEKDISKEPYYGFTVRMADRCCLIACHERNKQDGVIYQTPWGFRPLLKIQAVWLAVVEFIKWYNNTAAVGSR